jgi:acetyl/propionyl-CoA carboxylase alpha subunit
VRTNRELLVAVLEDGEFLAGEADVHFLSRRSPAELSRSCRPPDSEVLHAAAAALAEQSLRRRGAAVLRSAPSGWRNNPSQPQQVRYDLGEREVEVAYRFGREGLSVSVDGDPLDDLRLRSATPEAVDCEVGGIRRVVTVHVVGDEVFADSALGSTAMRRLPRFPPPATAAGAGSLVAPMPGVVVRVAVAVGDDVDAGQVVVVVESMKMEHPVRAPGAGRVGEVRVKAGDQVDAGEVLIVVGTP